MDKEFMKDDYAKPDLTLIPYNGLVAVAMAMEYGAKKYSRDNWRKGDAQRYVAAALRHLHAWSDPDWSVCDQESGESHLAHAACCILFAIHLEGEEDVE